MARTQKTVKDCRLGKVLRQLKQEDEQSKIHVQVDRRTWILVNKSEALERVENFKRNREVSEIKYFKNSIPAFL